MEGEQNINLKSAAQKIRNTPKYRKMFKKRVHYLVNTARPCIY